MPFTLDDNRRIRKHLGIPHSSKSSVESQMNSIKQENEIAAIQSVLDELDALDKKLAQLALDSNSRLVRADVIEWEPGGRIAGVQARQSELRKQLISALDLSSLYEANTSAAARVYRS